MPILMKYYSYTAADLACGVAGIPESQIRQSAT